MKKVLATILAVMFVLGSLSIVAFAGEYPKTITREGDMISFTGLDFNQKNNIWAKYDDAEGKWVSTGLQGQYYTADDGSEFYAAYSFADDVYYVWENDKFVKYEADDFYDNSVYGSAAYRANNVYLSELGGADSYLKHLDWSLSEDGEYITLRANDSSATPGIFLTTDEEAQYLPIGEESKGKAEFVSIRYRNKSSATTATFGFVTNNTNGGRSFMERSSTNFTIEPNTGDWVTKTFSMYEANSAMGHEQNNNGSAWGSNLTTFIIFPFGHNIDDGTGSYETAEMDIDYIVIGSEEFCKNYKSELQALEESVSSIELVSAPTKKDYYVGDTVDLEGLKIKATYTDGSTDTITDCSATYDFTSENDNAVVTLKYGANVTPITYNVKVTGISKVEITSPAKNTTYDVSSLANGMTASLIDGLKIKVTYNDGHESDEFTPYYKNVSISGTEAGDQQVTINYYGTTVTYAATVISITDIKVDDLTKEVYYNDAISKDDLTITCVYSDGSEKSLKDSGFADNLTDPVFDTTKFGEIEISVSLVVEAYDINVTGKAKATVATPEKLIVQSLPNKTTYSPDESLNTEGMVVEFVYADGKEAAVLDKDYTTRYDFSTPGTKTVTVRANGLTATFDVTVEGSAVSTKETTKKPTESSGCGSFIGFGAIAVIACAAAAGVVVCKKKEN